jgi:hypothetical protein
MGSARRPVPAEAETGTASKTNQLRISYIGYVEPVGMDCSRLCPLDVP